MADDWKSEDDVKYKYLVPMLKKHGYKEDCMEFNKTIEVQEGRKTKKIFADVVVYTSSKKVAPLLLCETKAPDEILDKSAKEQAISYARLLPKIAPVTLVTNGHKTQVFQTLSKNQLQELPARKDVGDDLVNFIVSRDMQEALRREAKHELFIIDDVTTFKSILKACHNEIRNNEGYDPTIAFDEMSKVLFCKLYEEKKNPDTNRFRLQTFDDTLDRLRVNVVRAMFEETKVNPDYSGLFNADDKIELDDRTIRKIVSLFEDSDLSLTAFDVKGEAYEYFLSDTFTGGLGEYFTPRNVVEFIVDAIDPKIGEKIVDPFCGTGGFLIYAFELVGEKIRLQDFSEKEKKKWKFQLSNECIYGTDWKERTSQACKMNMMVHGDGSAGIFKHHGLVDVKGHITEGEFDICSTNPPFGAVENKKEILVRYDLGNGRIAQDRLILAIERSIRLVKPGGWIGIDGILNNDREAYVREYACKNTWVKGIISLGKETFEGYGATAKTSILFLQKKDKPDEGEQSPVFFAIAKNTGYAPNGSQIAGNDLPEILMAYKAFHKDGKVPTTPLAWVAKLDDRMDAEFYRKREVKKTDLPKVRGEVSGLLSRAVAQHAKLDKAIESAGSSKGWAVKSLGELTEQVKVEVPLEPDTAYRQLGVRWWGEGVYDRETQSGKQIKSTKLYKVSAGWIVYNRLFAPKGSFALITPIFDGGFVSGEFPTFAMRKEVKDAELLSRYIVHCLNSPAYLEIVDTLTTGSTKQSRGRLTERRFVTLKIKIPPTTEKLASLVEMLDTADEFRRVQTAMLEQAKALRVGISSLLPSPD